jgi:ketosteroid isomerase-like protein
MNFEKLSKDDNHSCVSGTHLQGEIDVSYADLVRAFGEPTDDGDSYKIDAEWILIFEDGEVATIYNYKDGVNYNGYNEGMPTGLIRDWHIGGFNRVVVDRIQEILSAIQSS